MAKGRKDVPIGWHPAQGTRQDTSARIKRRLDSCTLTMKVPVFTVCNLSEVIHLLGAGRSSYFRHTHLHGPVSASISVKHVSISSCRDAFVTPASRFPPQLNANRRYCIAAPNLWSWSRTAHKLMFLIQLWSRPRPKCRAQSVCRCFIRWLAMAISCPRRLFGWCPSRIDCVALVSNFGRMSHSVRGASIFTPVPWLVQQWQRRSQNIRYSRETFHI